MDIKPMLDPSALKKITHELDELKNKLSDPSKIRESDIDDFLTGMKNIQDMVRKSTASRSTSAIGLFESYLRSAIKKTAAEDISGYSLDEIRSEVVRGLESIKGSDEWLTTGNDIVIRFQGGQILAILSEADNDGNVAEVTVPFDLVPGPVVKSAK